MSFKQYLIEIVTKSDWWFTYRDLEDVVDLVKQNVKILPIDEFKLEIQPDDYLDIKDVKNLNGFFGEKRQWYIDKDRKIAMFGNYTMKRWYELLMDIATNGLKEPILLSPNGTDIVEGNHRVQALYQLGYKKIPVIYERR